MYYFKFNKLGIFDMFRFAGSLLKKKKNVLRLENKYNKCI